MRVGVLWMVVMLLLPAASSAEEPPREDLRSLLTQADQFEKSGNLAGWNESTARVLELCQSDQFEPDDEQRIEALSYLGTIDFKIGSFARAFKTFEIVARDAAEGTVAQVLANAYLMYLKDASDGLDAEESIALLAEVSKAEKATPSSLEDFQSLTYTAFKNHILGDSFEKAIALRRSREIEDRLIEAGVPVGSARLTRLAYCELLLRVGVTTDFGEKLRESRAILDEMQSIIQDAQVSPTLRAIYWNLSAESYLQLGHYIDALDSCREFLKNARAPAAKAIAYDQAALVALRLGDYSIAKATLEMTGGFYDKQWSANQQMTPNDIRHRTNWLVNYSKALEGSQAFGESNRRLSEAADLIGANRDQLAEQAVLIDNNLGLNHYLQGEFSEAARLISRSRSTIQKLLQQNENLQGLGEQVGASAVNAGWIAYGETELDDSAKHFQDAANFFLKELGQNHPRYAETVTYQARVAALQGRREQATRWLQEAEDLVFQRICNSLASTESSRDRIAMIQEARVHPESIAWPGTIDTYLELAEELEIPAPTQYEVVLRWKGLLQRFESIQSDFQPSKQEQELEALLRSTYFKKASFSERRALETRILGYENQLRELRRVRRHERQVDPASLKIDAMQIAKRLGKQDLLLDIFQIRTFREPTSGARSIGSVQEYLGFLVHPDGKIDRVSLGTAEQLDEAINELRRSILEAEYIVPSDDPERDRQQQTQRIAELQAAARQVSQFIWKPLSDSDASFTHLQICPDGQTHLIPWAMLPGIKDHSYLIEDVRLQIVRSAVMDEKNAAENVEGPESLLVVGGVAFASAPELAGSVTEKAKVRDSFLSTHANGNVCELGAGADRATEKAVMEAIEGSNWIHLATHGFFQRRGESSVFEVTGSTTLLQIGLLFSPPTQADEGRGRDEYLTAAEIRKLDLSNANLVVLSACESGLGKSTAGQGVQGLLGSFHEAGAPFVIGTLWKVDDAATELLIERLYHHLWQDKLAPADALRAAQLDLLRTPKTETNGELLRDPYAWAAFVCSER